MASSYILIELGSKAKHVWVIGDWNLVIVCFLSFGAWNLLNSRTLLFLDTQFDFFNIYVGHDTIVSAFGYWIFISDIPWQPVR